MEFMLDDSIKGMPGGIKPFPASDIASFKWNILAEDLPLPLAVVNENALRQNNRWMKSFLKETGARICPHGKTTMSPEIFNLHLEAGAWGITAATTGHIQIYRRFGVQRILLANQLVGNQNIRYVLDELRRDPDFDFYCIVDSEDGIETLLNAIDRNPPGRPLQVLLEVGAMGGRTGVRTEDHALRLARVIHKAYPRIVLRGVEAYEAIFSGDSPEAVEANVEHMLDRVVAAAEACDREELFGEGPVIMSAGGSAYFDLVVNAINKCRLHEPAMTVLRCSSYLAHDSGLTARAFDRLKERLGPTEEGSNGLHHSVEVWAYVQSIPEDGLALVTIGKRDISFDIEMPFPLRIFRPGTDKTPRALPQTSYRVSALNDQHGYLRFPKTDDIRVGDMVAFGVSHPCTTFDKWRVLLTVDDDHLVTGTITTWF